MSSRGHKVAESAPGNGSGRRSGLLIFEEGVKAPFGRVTYAKCPKCNTRWETVGEEGRLIEGSGLVCPKGHLSIVNDGVLVLQDD
jgi:hypothetical protein